MARVVSIVLIVAIALQAVGCSSWRPLARASEVPKDDRQPSMRDQVLSKLREGMRVRIRIREGTSAPIKDEFIECVIEKIEETSLTVTPITFYVRNTEHKPFRLTYVDIVSIESRDANDLLVLMGGILFGVGLAYFLISLAFSQ